MCRVKILEGCSKEANENINYVYNIIMNHQGNRYDDAIQNDYRPSVFKALTDRRTAEFGWYIFKKNSRVLEINADWGGCTGELCNKCGSVVAVEENLYKAQGICRRHEDKDNLAVYAGDWHFLMGEGLYDYVIFHDVEEYWDEWNDKDLSGLLRELCAFLQPEGSLLLNIANRYAMKYWCGEPRILLQPEFPDLGEEARRHGFSKREIEEALARVEGISYKFYYPMFERHMPQQIFTDAHLPERKSLREMELYRRYKDIMLNSEREMYDFSIKEGIFPTVAEAFLVECVKEQGQLSRINYAKISADRPRGLAMTTAIMEDKVVKIALFEEGVGHLRDMMDYQKDLQTHSIPMVPMEYSNNMVTMPLVKQKKLSEYLKYLAETDREAFVDCLDKLYDLICRSSEHVPVEDSSFCSEAVEIEWGPILKHAYLELIDLNCFFDGNYLFFDQEYMRGAMPAKYIMYRELLNLYYAHPEVEHYIKETDMLARFGIDKLIDVLEKEEYGNFLDKLVDKKLYLRLMQPHDVLAVRQEKGRQQEARRETYLFAGCAGKTLAVIGCGTRFKRYMQQYGKRYSPDILVDNNSDKWGEEVCGVVVSKPQRLDEIDSRQLHVIICIKDYEAIEAQLLKMKIYNYRIF